MSEKLYLGVSKVQITPKIGGNLMGYRPDVYSEAINDDLTATVFAFSQGELTALMISVSLCLISFEVNDRILGILSEKFGIPKGNIILSATHTHSGPITADQVGWGDIDTVYVEEILIPKIMTACENALASRVYVKMGVGVGESLVGVNRRELRPDNYTDFGQNPWGPLNKQMTVISFMNEDGEILANMIHYGCHGTASGCNKEVSRDWPGVMEDVLTRDTGGISAFFNGPQGDIGPRCTNGGTTGEGNIACAMELGGYAARDAKSAFDSIRVYRDAELSVFSSTVSVPLDKRIPKEEAEIRLEPLKNEWFNARAAEKDYLETVIASYENGYEDKSERLFGQTIVRIGDVAFVAFPLELFCEIGMRIDKYCREIPYVLSLSNSNGAASYFVTEDQVTRGGYEVVMYKQMYIQPYAKDADFALICGTLENLKGVQ